MQPSADADERAALVRRIYRQLSLIGYGANGVAAVVSLLYGVLLLPGTRPGDLGSAAAIRNIVAFVVLVPLSIGGARLFFERSIYRPVATWLLSGDPPSAAQHAAVLRLPFAWSMRVLVGWAGAVAIFTLLNLDAGVGAIGVAVMIGVGAVVTTSLQYLLTELVMRPIAAIVLAGRAPPADTDVPGVTARFTMAWALGAGAPMVGILGVAVLALTAHGISRDRLAVACGLPALIGLAAGAAAIRLASRSVAAPLRELRDSFASVDAGHFDRRVTVDDGSEVGRLQAGFNSMVTGLDERERLREAFGTYVDPALIDRVLGEGVDLAGEELDLTVMFTDVRGFTSFAESTSPRDAVARLNELYDVVVPLVTKAGGHAAKFIGDGLLVVFGAPVRQADHASRAVGCAQQVLAAVADRFGDALRIGVGVNSGPVVAGTIGGGGRLDFTVIGDTVNTAARVEAATRQTGDDLLITDATWQLLDVREGWTPRGAIELKGKADRVAVYAPCASELG